MYYKNNTIIVFCGSLQQLLIYNLVQQKITKRYQSQYQAHIVHNPEMCIDSDDNIYIGSNNVIITVNLNSNKWSWISYDTIPRWYYVPALNTLFQHATPNQSHATVFDLLRLAIRRDQYFYRGLTDQLFMVTAGQIAVQKIDVQRRTLSQWKVYPKGLPYNLSNASNSPLLLAFDQLIFFFDYGRRSNMDICGNWRKIWVLDLDHADKWYPAAHQIPASKLRSQRPSSKLYAVADDQMNVHLLNFGGDPGQTYHWRMSLHHLIPQAIKKLNKDRGKRYEASVMGYVREKFAPGEHMVQHLPMCLIKLIYKFYYPYLL